MLQSMSYAHMQGKVFKVAMFKPTTVLLKIKKIPQIRVQTGKGVLNSYIKCRRLYSDITSKNIAPIAKTVSTISRHMQPVWWF